MHSSCRNRLIAFVAAFAMIVTLCGYCAQGYAGHAAQPDHCDLALHFAGVAGSHPQPVVVTRPVLTAWVSPSRPSVGRPAARRIRAHLARAPPSLV